MPKVKLEYIHWNGILTHLDSQFLFHYLFAYIVKVTNVFVLWRQLSGFMPKSFSMIIILDTENQHFYKLHILSRKVLRDSPLSTIPRKKGAPLFPIVLSFPCPPVIQESKSLFISAEFINRNRLFLLL